MTTDRLPGDPITSGFNVCRVAGCDVCAARQLSPEAMARVQAKADSSRLARGKAEAEAKSAVIT